MTEPLAGVTRGEGTAVLLVHGYAVDHRILLPLEPAFDRHPAPWERVYVDLPGHGASPSDPAIRSADDIAAALDRFVDERFGDRPFAVVGGSFGGVLARRLVARRGAQVLGIALLSPSAEPVLRRTLPPREVRVRDEAMMASLSPLDAVDFDEMVVVQTPEVWARYREFVQPGVRAANGDLLERVGDRPSVAERPEDAFERFERPGLMVVGRQDHVVGFADQLALAPHYPRMTIAVLDGAGHNAHIERPAVVDALFMDWLDAVTAEGPAAG